MLNNTLYIQIYTYTFHASILVTNITGSVYGICGNLTSLCEKHVRPKYLRSQMKMRGNRDEREQRLQNEATDASG